MKNNKGFTLIELLGIVVILVAIFLVAFPSLLGTTKQDEQKLYTSMVDDLCLAGETYIYSNIDDFPELSTPDSVIKLKISTLIKDGNVSKDKTNPKTGEKISDDLLSFKVLNDNSLECEYIETLTLVHHITNLYKPNSTVVNNDITYNVDTINQIIDDSLGGTVSSGGNLRYYGANPNNYIDIGDRDENDNPILWRIIGVFETKYATDKMPCNVDSDNDGHYDNCASEKLVKIIRDNSIGVYSWDNKTFGIGSSISDHGSNDWTDARLMMLLNPGYENGYENNIYNYHGSLFWNSSLGTCYISKYDGTIDCNFTNTGLSLKARNKIENTLWNLGGWDKFDTEMYPNNCYSYERSTKVFKGNNIDNSENHLVIENDIERPTEWLGKIAIMYPSDYGYASDLKQCDMNLDDNIISDTCLQTNWLTFDSYQWTLTPYSSYYRSVYVISSDGKVDSYYPAYPYANSTNKDIRPEVRPALYLKADTVLTGTATTSDGISYYIVD